MIAISIGFGIFPTHLYDVVRSGVDPLIVRITEVVPVAQSGSDEGVQHTVSHSKIPLTSPIIADEVAATPLQISGGRE